MLEALMKIGGYRVERFIHSAQTGDEFGMYVRGMLSGAEVYSRVAKQQLYYGLATLYKLGELKSLAGIYLDIAQLEDLQRPAYQQLKHDMLEGRFHRVMILDVCALFGCEAAEKDLKKLSRRVAGFELFTFMPEEADAICLQSLLRAQESQEKFASEDA